MNTSILFLLVLNIVNNWLLLPIFSYPSYGIGENDDESLDVKSDEHKRFKRSLADAADAGDFEESALPVYPEVNPFEYQPIIENGSSVGSNDFDTPEPIGDHELHKVPGIPDDFNSFSNPEYRNELGEIENNLQQTPNEPAFEDMPQRDEDYFDNHEDKLEMPHPVVDDEHVGENNFTDSEYDDSMRHQLTSEVQNVTEEYGKLIPEENHYLEMPNDERPNTEHDVNENGTEVYESLEDTKHENVGDGIIDDNEESVGDEIPNDHLANGDESFEHENQHPENPIETPSDSEEIGIERKTPIEANPTNFGDGMENVTEMQNETLPNEQTNSEVQNTLESSSVIQNEAELGQVEETEGDSKSPDDEEPLENFSSSTNHTESEQPEEDLVEITEITKDEPIEVVNETQGEDLGNGDVILEHEEPNQENSNENMPDESELENDTPTAENLPPNKMPEVQNGTHTNEEPSSEDAKHIEPEIRNEPAENTTEKSEDLENQRPASEIDTNNTENTMENLTETTKDVKKEPKTEPAEENQQNEVFETQTLAPDGVIEPRTVPTNTESDGLSDAIGNELIDNINNNDENGMSPLKLSIILVVGPTIAMILLIALSIIIRKKVDTAKGRSVVYELSESLGTNKNGKDVIST